MVIAAVVAVLIVNYLLVWRGYEPYLYCTFKDRLWSMYQPIQALITLCGLLAFVVGVVRKNYGVSFGAVMFMCAVYLGPNAAGLLFSVGGKCS